MKHFQICRELKADIWGELLLSKKPLKLLNSVYRPIYKRSRYFVLRIDQTKPRQTRKALSKYSRGIVDKAKFAAFYDYSPNSLRHIILREKHLFGNTQQRLLSFLESQLHIILWRTQMFRLQTHAKDYIKSGAVRVAGKRIINPKFRAVKYDLITLKKPRLGWLKRLLYKRMFRLREHHILIRYKAPCIFYLRNPNPRKLFHFFRFHYANIFFTPRNP